MKFPSEIEKQLAMFENMATLKNESLSDCAEQSLHAYIWWPGSMSKK